MKKFLFLTIFFSSGLIANEETLCKMRIAEMLTFTVSDTVFTGEEAKPFMEIQKKLQDELNDLCKTDKSSIDIISEMYNRCFKLTQEKVKTQISKFRFEKACDIAYTAATYYIEGLEEGQKESSEKVCDNKNTVPDPERSLKQIEREIPPGIPEINKKLKK